MYPKVRYILVNKLQTDIFAFRILLLQYISFKCDAKDFFYKIYILQANTESNKKKYWRSINEFEPILLTVVISYIME